MKCGTKLLARGDITTALIIDPLPIAFRRLNRVLSVELTFNINTLSTPTSFLHAPPRPARLIATAAHEARRKKMMETGGWIAKGRPAEWEIHLVRHSALPIHPPLTPHFPTAPGASANAHGSSAMDARPPHDALLGITPVRGATTTSCPSPFRHCQGRPASPSMSHIAHPRPPPALTAHSDTRFRGNLSGRCQDDGMASIDPDDDGNRNELDRAPEHGERSTTSTAQPRVPASTATKGHRTRRAPAWARSAQQEQLSVQDLCAGPSPLPLSPTLDPPPIIEARAQVPHNTAWHDERGLKSDEREHGHEYDALHAGTSKQLPQRQSDSWGRPVTGNCDKASATSAWVGPQRTVGRASATSTARRYERGHEHDETASTGAGMTSKCDTSMSCVNVGTGSAGASA
ncbi:hypothetical protein BJ912DRAFT_1098475 [Pholiota molesta]|nr:hypothetical protein BJ912DRAFT_1098475 [Pholiota molesta]